jgi:CheY-like chemotaxis protein
MSKCVMVIDDSPVVRKLIEVILSREGYEVVSVPDGVEALRVLLAPGARLPDLIVLDLVMPRMGRLGVRPHHQRAPAIQGASSHRRFAARWSAGSSPRPARWHPGLSV